MTFMVFLHGVYYIYTTLITYTMSLSKKIVDVVTTANAKAFATHGPHGINVVPVSILKVTPDSIWLFDFFMDKTITNLKANPKTTLTAWTGLQGVQIKTTATYITTGEDFDAGVAFVKTQNPERVVKGLIVLVPNEIFDISPGGVFTSDELCL